MTLRVLLRAAAKPATIYCLCLSSAWAQSTAQPVALREVVVTATRFAEPVGERPVNLGVISRDEIARSAARTVPELLSTQPGIAVRELFGGGSSGATVDLRGFGSVAAQNTLILVDGRPLNDIDLGGVAWSSLPLSAIERIEILRGGGAVQFGAGATAGVINVITRLPRDGERSAEATLQMGSLATRAAALAGNFGSGPLALRLYGSTIESDGYRANSRNVQDVGQADMRWRDGVNTLTARFGLDRQSSRLPGARRVQPSAGVNEVVTDPRGTSTPRDFATRDGARASLDFDRVLDIGEFNLGLGWRSKTQDAYFDFGGFPNYSERELTVLAFTPRLRIAHLFAGASASTTIGVDVYRWDYRLLSSNSQANIARPVNTVDAAQDNKALYLATTVSMPTGTTLTAGLRGERYEISATDVFDPTAPGAGFGSAAQQGAQSTNQHAWELGVRQALTSSLALIGKAGRSFRFANVDEIYGFTPTFSRQYKFLKPQTSTGGEIALDYSRPGAAARLALYRMDVDDEIRLDPFTSGVGNTNLPSLRREGLELGGHWQAARTLRLNAAYTYTRARFQEGVLAGSPPFSQTNIALTGRTVPLVPDYQLVVGGAWTPVQALTLSANARRVGAAFMDNDEGNTLGTRIPAYTLVDLRGAYDHGGWQFAVAVNNLFDRNYFNYAVRSTSAFTPDRYNAYPLPGRTLLATVRYRFQ